MYKTLCQIDVRTDRIFCVDKRYVAVSFAIANLALKNMFVLKIEKICFTSIWHSDIMLVIQPSIKYRGYVELQKIVNCQF